MPDEEFHYPKIATWKSGGEDTYYHWCPACERLHVIPPNRWTRTGPDEAPTYSPSFLQYGAAGKGKNCHYFIQNGKLQYCGDSWHGRSDLVDMPDIPLNQLERLGHGVYVTIDAVFYRKAAE